MADKTLAELANDMRRVPAELDRNITIAIRVAGHKIASEAKSNHRYTDRSGVLTASTMPDGPFGSFRDDSLTATVSAGAPYAVYVEKGTKRHKIKPKYRRALRWPVEGGYQFAKVVDHPGTEATNFLKDAVEKVSPEVAGRLIPQAVELSFVQSGFERD